MTNTNMTPDQEYEFYASLNTLTSDGDIDCEQIWHSPLELSSTACIEQRSLPGEAP
jgi:hypothetical protein